MIRALVLVLAAACGPTLTAQSAAPPGRTAAFDSDGSHYDLALSQGVAIAIGCEHGGPCKDVVVSTTDAAIADVKGAAFASLARSEYTGHTWGKTGVVIVGKQPGKAKVKVKTADGARTIHVTVIGPPAAGEPATVAQP